MTISHPLPECERAFGRIEESQKAAKERLQDQSARIENVHKEIIKLTGNGHRGRMDDLAEQTAVNTALLQKLDATLDKFDKRMDAQESKVFSMAVKVASIAGTIGIIGSIVVGKLM